MVTSGTNVSDVKLRICTHNGKTQTRIVLRQSATLIVGNESNKTLSVRLDAKDALMLNSLPVDQFDVPGGNRALLTVNPKFPVGNSFKYSAQIAGSEVEDPIIIIED